MRQTLHIFQKDVRQRWLELTISLLALAILTWSEWWQATPEFRPNWYYGTLPLLAVFPGWWFLVVRLVQGEALVGDRQFWVTRPYNWYKLLAAKALFVLAWVAVPLAISEALLVFIDGSSIAPHIIPILRDSGLAVLVGILPFAAIATLARNLAQWALYLAALVVVVIGIAAFGSSAPNSQIPVGTAVADTLQAVAVACLCAGGILVQYAFRKVLWGMLFVLAAIVSLPVIIIGTPYRRIMQSAYPTLAAGTAPVHAVFGPDERTAISAVPSEKGGAKLTLTIELSVLPNGTLATLDAGMIAIDSPHARRWESEWKSVYNELIERFPRSLNLHFELDRATFERTKAENVQLRLALAFSELKDGAPRFVAVYRHFDLPTVGHCWVEDDGYEITCRSTEAGPSMVLASLPGDGSCAEGLRDTATGKCLLNHTQGLRTDLGPLSPLTLYKFRFTNSDGSRTGAGRVHAGEQLNFSTPKMAGRFRLDLDLGMVKFSGRRTVAFSDRRQGNFLGGVPANR